MLKKAASFVLASLKGSTYRCVRLASSLAAALMDGHFEHLLGRFSLAQDMLAIEVSRGLHSFSAAYQDEESVSDHDSVATQDVN
jgi:hypothetical protein